MGKKQSIINFSRRIIHTNSIIFYTSFFHHRKGKQTPRIVQINPKKNAILWEGTEKALKKSLCNRHQRAAFALHD